MLHRLKLIRTRLSLSQEQIAACLHISRQSYSMYERGVREPSVGLLIRFSDVTHVSLDYILERDDTPPFHLTTPEEEELLKSFRELDAAGQQYILEQVEYELYLARRFGEESRPSGCSARDRADR